MTYLILKNLLSLTVRDLRKKDNVRFVCEPQYPPSSNNSSPPTPPGRMPSTFPARVESTANSNIGGGGILGDPRDSDSDALVINLSNSSAGSLNDVEPITTNHESNIVPVNTQNSGNAHPVNWSRFSKVKRTVVHNVGTFPNVLLSTITV